MAQGAIALFEKNIKDALIIAREYDRVRSTTDDKEQEQIPDDVVKQFDLQEEELPF